MNPNRAFTLKEVLIGLTIIGLLIVLLYPVYQITRYRVLETRCRANLWAILIKYKQLKMEYNGKVGTEEFIEAFRAWMATPEGQATSYCPLSHRGYSFSDRVNYHCYVENPNIPQEFLVVDSSILVAWCSCHRRPVAPTCVYIPYVIGEQYLAALDIGDGQVRYAKWEEIRTVLRDQQEIRRRFEECRRWMQKRGIMFPPPEKKRGATLTQP
ncbi:hypothetical protein HRbin15_02415 [bacterium HR15]|nr:hypothetical protein HRbin15_02415 [bacterium HR15]